MITIRTMITLLIWDKLPVPGRLYGIFMQIKHAFMQIRITLICEKGLDICAFITT